MSNNHIVELPKAVWGLKIAQLVLAVLILAISAYGVYYTEANAHAFAIFTALYTILILIYYFIAIHGSRKLYNWIALLVLECVAVVFWLCTWAVLAAWRGILFAVYYEVSMAYYALLYVSIALSVVVFILYVVTLVFMGIGVHRHRTANKPMNYHGTGAWNNGSAVEKNEMNDMHCAPSFPNQATNPAPAAYEQQYDGPSPVSSNMYPANPAPANAHEVQGSQRY